MDKNDIDRQWTGNELRELSESEYTQLQFFKDLKNFMVFIPLGFIVLYVVGDGHGLFAKIIGWGAALLFLLFAFESLYAFLLTVISIIKTLAFDSEERVKSILLKVCSLSLSVLNIGVYGVFAYFIYVAL